MSIIKGFANLALDREKELAKKRRAICKGCPISEYGNSRFCKVTKGGCGCLISAKTRDAEEYCPVGKWHSVDLNKTK